MCTTSGLVEKDSLKHLFLLINIASIFLGFSCINTKSEALLSVDVYEQIVLTNFGYDTYFRSINGEILNNTDYVLVRLVYEIRLYEYDINCRLRELYEIGGEVFNMGDFSSFVEKISRPEGQKRFWGAVSQEFEIGSFADLTSAVNQFNKSNKKLVLARKMEIETRIEPTLSQNFHEEIRHTIFANNLIHVFRLQEAYGHR